MRWLTGQAILVCFFFQAEDGIRDLTVTGVQTCALPICQSDGRALDGAQAVIKNLEHDAPRHHGGRLYRGNPAVPGSVVRFGVDTWVGRKRSEERRVGEEGRSRWSPYHYKKKKKDESVIA